MEPKLNHFDGAGHAIMVDVSAKSPTRRLAVAQGKIRVSPAVLAAVSGGTAAKGDVLGVARVAGILAAKRTAELIPLCHPLALSHCTVDFTLLPEESAILAECTAKLDARTGVEMEALTGVSVALLTLSDSCKAMDKTMEMGEIRLVYKEGGKSGTFSNSGRRGPAVVAVSGVKNAGKTTLITAMLPHLAAAGLKVATIKHDGHSFPAEPEGTDTGRHLAAGAWGAAIFDGEKYKMVRRDAVDEEALIARFSDADLVLLEGFKHSRWPKLELVRAGVSQTSVCDPSTLLALATDQAISLPGVPTIPLEGEAAARVVLDYLRKEGRL